MEVYEQKKPALIPQLKKVDCSQSYRHQSLCTLSNKNR